MVELPESSETSAVRVPTAVGLKVTVMLQTAVPPGQEGDGLGLTEVVTAETEKSPGLAPPMVSEAAGEPLMTTVGTCVDDLSADVRELDGGCLAVGDLVRREGDCAVHNIVLQEDRAAVCEYVGCLEADVGGRVVVNKGLAGDPGGQILVAGPGLQ